ncbi:MAG TPA: ribosome maturation factor RimP [Polyangiaceae bacterium]
MRIAHEKLVGLDREKIISALEPVLSVHAVDCVELVWKTDRGESLLEVTVEKPETRDPGAGVTLDLCAEISRDLSAALDAADCIDRRYRLEVGSPGVERQLYGAHDYERFVGHEAKLKLKKPVKGEYVVTGTLEGLEDEKIAISIRGKRALVELADVDKGQLVFAWKRGKPAGGHAPWGGDKKIREQELPAEERSR